MNVTTGAGTDWGQLLGYPPKTPNPPQMEEGQEKHRPVRAGWAEQGTGTLAAMGVSGTRAPNPWSRSHPGVWAKWGEPQRGG